MRINLDLEEQRVKRKRKGGSRVMVSQVWWLTPVIPATQEVEIVRIMIPGQPQQKFTRPHLNQ
jgi:hypothetical protein